MVRRTARINGVKAARTIQHGLICYDWLGCPGFPLIVPLCGGLLILAKGRTVIGLLTLAAAGVGLILRYRGNLV